MNIFVRFIAVPVLLVFLASTGFGWGNATHTHFSKQLGVWSGHLNYNEMYGSVLTDAFNLMLEPRGFVMADLMHHNFMPFVLNARTCGQRASAFGVASHNDNWGADYTAHHNSFTFSGTGYAIQKGEDIAPSIILILVPIFMDAGLDEPTATAYATFLAPEFGHDLSETAVDLLLRQMDPSIGVDMVQAAKRRSSDVGQLLADTYAGPLAAALEISPVEAKKFIMGAERDYRDQMIQYGQILMLPDEQAIGTLAYVSAMAAEQYIKAFVGVNAAVDPQLVAGMLLEAIALTSPDFASELNQTLAYLENELEANGITTCSSRSPVATIPFSASLSENFPNPFNPSTTIRFSVPAASVVSLEIFNVIGQRVRTLVDAQSYEQGSWSVVWDGKNDAGVSVPSGTYISRLTTPGGVISRKMIMMK